MWPLTPKPEISRREQLIEARDKLRRQIEILRAGPVDRRDYTAQTAVLIDTLSRTLSEIESALDKEDASEPRGAPDNAQTGLDPGT